jgi:GTP-sensing pleiotropic transcriptional regulator CodY
MSSKSFVRSVDRTLSGYEPEMTGTLCDWLRAAGDEGLARINVFQVADRIGAERSRLLAAFVRLVDAGVWT